MKYFTDIWYPFDEAYAISDWIDMDEEIDPSVPKADRKLIRWLGYVAVVVFFVIWILLMILSISIGNILL